MVRSNLHTHSVFSDGINTIEEIADKAIEKGFLTLGMSDHSFTEFDDTFCMKENDFDAYIEKISQLKKVYEGRLDLFAGMELDYYSKDIKTELLDYVIGSVHYLYKNGIYYPIDHTREQEKLGIDEGCGGDVNLFIKAYFESLCNHVSENKIDVIGHFDVLTKFGLIDENDAFYRKEAKLAVDYIVEKGVIIEINTGAVFKKLKSFPYPHSFILEHIRERGGRVVIDADAHVADNINFYFEESCEIMKQAGFKTACMLTKNGFVDYAI